MADKSWILRVIHRAIKPQQLTMHFPVDENFLKNWFRFPLWLVSKPEQLKTVGEKRIWARILKLSNIESKSRGIPDLNNVLVLWYRNWDNRQSECYGTKAGTLYDYWPSWNNEFAAISGTVRAKFGILQIRKSTVPSFRKETSRKNVSLKEELLCIEPFAVMVVCCDQ